MRTLRSSAGWLRSWFPIALAVTLGCRQVPVETAAPRTERIGAAQDQIARLEAGRSIYTDREKCARCHKPKPVADHNAEEWANSILPKMARKAKLSSSEYDEVLAYVLAARTVSPEPPATR
jgi:mono/diheme cytochrome c family protein